MSGLALCLALSKWVRCLVGFVTNGGGLGRDGRGEGVMSDNAHLVAFEQMTQLNQFIWHGYASDDDWWKLEKLTEFYLRCVRETIEEGHAIALAEMNDEVAGRAS
jgi:hypothetical protein